MRRLLTRDRCLRAAALVAGAFALIGCATAPNPVTAENSAGVTVTVDPRVELLAIAQGLSSYPYQSIPLTLAYGREVREHFAGETGARREEYTDFAAFLPVLLEELPRRVADRM